MAFVRLKKVSGHYYASKVESYRNEQGKVRQRTLENYGRVDRGFIRRLLNRRPSQGELNRTVERGTRYPTPESAQNGV